MLDRVAVLRMTPSLLLGMFKFLKPGPPQFFRVIENAVPDDAELVRIRTEGDYVEFVIRHESFPEVECGEPIPVLPQPMYVITHPKRSG